MPSTEGVATRSKNVVTHPGLVVKGKTRRSTSEVAAERQAKEDAKEKKALTKAIGIKRVAAYEVDQAEKHAADATPRAKPKSNLKPLTRTRSYANILVGSDAEMKDGEKSDGDFHMENEDTVTASNTETETESVELPPKKKKKVVENSAGEKVNASKPKIRDAIEEEKKNLVGPRANNNDLDLDLTPNPKRTRLADPATDKAISHPVQVEGELPSWAMPTLGDNGSLAVKSGDGGEKKGKGKGKTKKTIKLDGKANANASNRKSDTRVLPKSKSDSTSNGKKLFKAGINDRGASDLSDLNTTSTATKRSTSTYLSADLDSNAAAGVNVSTNANTQSSSNSVLSKQVMVTTKVMPASKGIQITDGGLSDKDESVGVERDAAVASPVKGKQRATSVAVVKVSSETVKVVSRPKKLVNNDLPDGVELKAAWRRSFVSTYMQFVGSSANPWDIPPKLACEKMQLIWDAVFPDIKYDVTSTSTVYHIAIQRVADSWRSSIGSAGITALIMYFESQSELRDSDENRERFSAYALDKLRFLYQKADGDNKQKFRGLYQGALVVQTLTAHFSAINGAQAISGVDVSGGTILEARGALALSCASVQRALTLVATRTLTVDMIHNSKGRNVTLPKTLNHSTGKKSNRQTGFNDVTWGLATRNYVKSISKAYKKRPEKFNKIVSFAKESTKKSCHADDGAGNASGDITDDEDNLDDELVDISSSDEDATTTHNNSESDEDATTTHGNSESNEDATTAHGSSSSDSD